MDKDSAQTSSTPKHAGGRPTDYYPEICDELPFMFEEGQSVIEVATELGICTKTYYNWEKEHPEFLHASTYGKQIAQAYLERMGRTNFFDTEEYDAESKISTKKKFNATLWGRIMGARFTDWREKREISGEGGDPIVLRIIKASEAAPDQSNDA